MWMSMEDGASGTLNVEGGEVLLGGSLGIHYRGSTGNTAINITDGSVLTCSRIYQRSGSSAVNVLIDDGILRAYADRTDFLPNASYLTVKVGNGGATFDCDGHDITIAKAIEDAQHHGRDQAVRPHASHRGGLHDEGGDPQSRHHGCQTPPRFREGNLHDLLRGRRHALHRRRPRERDDWSGSHRRGTFHRGRRYHDHRHALLADVEWLGGNVRALERTQLGRWRAVRRRQRGAVSDGERDCGSRCRCQRRLRRLARARSCSTRAARRRRRFQRGRS